MYHGSCDIVQCPDFSKSREDTEFGCGFYLSEDKNVASRWACNRKKSILNTYSIDLSKLNVFEFKLDVEWLIFVVKNRDLEESPKYASFDLLIGPMVDDRLQNVISLYEDDYITAKDAIKSINSVDCQIQYVAKTQKAAEVLRDGFLEYKEISGEEKEKIRGMYW